MKLCQGGPNLRRGGSISVRGFGRGGGQNPRGVQIRYDTGIFETLTDIDDFTICPTHIDVGQSCGSNSRCRVPKEVSGHCNGKVKSIPKADRGIGKRVSQVVLKMSGKFIQPGSGKQATYHREQNYALRQT